VGYLLICTVESF